MFSMEAVLAGSTASPMPDRAAPPRPQTQGNVTATCVNCGSWRVNAGPRGFTGGPGVGQRGQGATAAIRSEERRVGKECRARWAASAGKKNRRTRKQEEVRTT